MCDTLVFTRWRAHVQTVVKQFAGTNGFETFGVQYLRLNKSSNPPKMFRIPGRLSGRFFGRFFAVSWRSAGDLLRAFHNTESTIQGATDWT